jgi:Rne/Rng family ribonuclease
VTVAQDIIVEVSPGETRAAAVDRDGQLVAFEVERCGEESQLGAVCLGRVTRVDQGAGGAFVEAGLGEAGFLPRVKGLHEGQTLIVQVSRDAWRGKGPALTMRPTLAGKYLVLQPGGSGLRWARGMGGAQKDLAAALEGLVAPDEGVTVRSGAARIDAALVTAELDRLRARWTALEAAAKAAPGPGILVSPPGIAQRAMRDWTVTGQVVLDDRRLAAELAAAAREDVPDMADRIALHTGDEPVFAAAGVEEQIDEALARSVALPGGGNLVIDTLEALTAIDVNLGGGEGRRLSEDAIFRGNRNAGVAAARQVMLRNIAGLIVIDFVSMRNKGNRRKLVEAVRNAFRADRATVDVLGMTPAGLIEVTRQRRGRPLADAMLTPVERTPRLKPAAAGCAALRAALRQLGAGRPVLRCAPAVAKALEGPLRPAWDETARRLGQPLELRPDPACDEFEILLER